MIGAGALLYQVTGDRTYLQQAEQTAAASVSYYGSDGNLYHQPDVFNAIFFRNLFALAKFDHDPSYARMAAVLRRHGLAAGPPVDGAVQRP